MSAHRFPYKRRLLGTAVGIAAVAVGAALATTAGAAHRMRGADKGIVTGAIHRVGGPATVTPQPPQAGEVSVFTASGRLVARQHVRAGHLFRFKLDPGRYLLNSGRQLYNKRASRNDCKPVKARVRAGQTVHVNVGYGCGWM